MILIPMSFRRGLSFLSLGAALLLIPGPTFASDATFSGLGDLSGFVSSSKALAVSDDGSTVVGMAASPNGSEAFRWTTAGGMVGLGMLTGSISRANGVSADGSVVVGQSSSGTGVEAFRWTSAGGMVGLGDLPGGSFASFANDVSSDGSTVVGSGSGLFATLAFRWTSATGMTSLRSNTIPGVSDCDAHSTSADGSTIVGTDTSNEYFEAFRWTAQTGIVGIGIASDVVAIAGDGSAIATNHGSEAVRWTEADGMVGLGDLPSGNYGSQALDTSLDGGVIVGWGTVSSSMGGTYPYHRAFIWDSSDGMRMLEDVLTSMGLDMTGWILDEAHGVSADGRTIVGWGTNPLGDTEGWIATLPPIEFPEPSNLPSMNPVGFALLLGMLALSGTARLISV
jgi:probable HAF family extracellular repeat protein